MGKGSRSTCKSTSHILFKDKAKNRVDDLQGIFSDLQSARKESRTNDVVLLEEQVHQMLREWKAELNEPSPASSLNGNSLCLPNLSSDVLRLLQLHEEEDDATSALAAPVDPKREQVIDARPLCSPAEHTAFQEDYIDQVSQGFNFQEAVQCEDSVDLKHEIVKAMNSSGEYPYHHSNLHHSFYLHLNDTTNYEEDLIPSITCVLPRICPPPAAFMGPKCALWDCNRPAQGSEYCKDYCSTCHADLAVKEGPPGMTPVVRPGGIDLKDGPLFAALTAKTQGKAVGIPVCEGAATTKSPWNAPELFDLSVLDGESIREWLFFDKPRRAFESGNRKQRSLPDYSGRGWHESRKQVIKEFDGLKRSYYMDPQPMHNFEWHLYEYEINNYNACALYRLELKLVNFKKSAKGKFTGDSVVDLQQQVGRLVAESLFDSKRHIKSKVKANNVSEETTDSYSVCEQVGYLERHMGYGIKAAYGTPLHGINEFTGT